MPRRVTAYNPDLHGLNIFVSIMAFCLGTSMLIFLVNLVWSLIFRREPAGPNPWGAVGLEWATSSPPPHDNFHETPVVTWDAYDYPAMMKAMGETQNV